MAGRAWSRSACGHRAAVLPGLVGGARLHRKCLPHRGVAGRQGLSLPTLGSIATGWVQKVVASGQLCLQQLAGVVGAGGVAAAVGLGS